MERETKKEEEEKMDTEMEKARGKAQRLYLWEPGRKGLLQYNGIYHMTSIRRGEGRCGHAAWAIYK